MKTILSKLVLFAFLGSFLPDFGFANVPGRFDYFVLAMSHFNSFCSSGINRVECNKSSTYYQSGMVLHGLWPTVFGRDGYRYGYCNVVRERKRVGCDPNSKFPHVISQNVIQKLLSVMPGYASCLHEHEWNSHGSCSGWSADEYFNVSAELANRFRMLPNFQKLIKDYAGQFVQRSVVDMALMTDLGPNFKTVTQLRCHNDGGTSQLSEIKIGISKTRYAEFPNPQSLVSIVSVDDEGNVSGYSKKDCIGSKIFIAR